MGAPRSVFTAEEIRQMPDTAQHPLPVGTKISYADYSPRVNATVVANDNTDPAFIAAVQQFDAKIQQSRGADGPAHEPTPPEHMDYCIVVDGWDPDQAEDGSWLPVQRDGVRLERVPVDEHRRGMLR